MARKSKNKILKYSIAIVGEGATEWYYFDSLRTEKRYSFQVSPELPTHSDFASIFRSAEKLAIEGFDEVFCVLDLDVFDNGDSIQKYKVKKNLLLKQYSNIHVFETMPCFELWFILHFKDYSTKFYNSSAELILELKRHLPEYEKKKTYFEKINLYKTLTDKGNLEKAITSAKRLCTEKAIDDNPKFSFTEVYEVLEKLDKH